MIFCNVFTFHPFVINCSWLNNLKYTVKRPPKYILYQKKLLIQVPVNVFSLLIHSDIQQRNC